MSDSIRESLNCNGRRLVSLPLHKVGTPLPVDRPTDERTIEILRKAFNTASVDREKVKAFRRLARLDSIGNNPA